MGIEIIKVRESKISLNRVHRMDEVSQITAGTAMKYQFEKSSRAMVCRCVYVTDG